MQLANRKTNMTKNRDKIVIRDTPSQGEQPLRRPVHATGEMLTQDVTAARKLRILSCPFSDFFSEM